jgi:hypothetical protein
MRYTRKKPKANINIFTRPCSAALNAHLLSKSTVHQHKHLPGLPTHNHLLQITEERKEGTND